MKSRVLRLKKHANLENIRLARLRSQYFVTLSAILFRYAPDDSRANNSIRTVPPTFTNVTAPNSGHAKSPLQVCGDLLPRFLEIPFLPRAHGRDLEADCPYYCRQKMSRAADRRPRARPRAWLLLPAAESFYLTEVANFLSIFLNGRPPCRTAD